MTGRSSQDAGARYAEKMRRPLTEEQKHEAIAFLRAGLKDDMNEDCVACGGRLDAGNLQAEIDGGYPVGPLCVNCYDKM